METLVVEWKELKKVLKLESAKVARKVDTMDWK
jgi:hypothetical protein